MTDFSKRGPRNKAEIRELIALRRKQHQGTKTHRPLSKDFEWIGLLGELQFANEFNLTTQPDQPTGDKGVDFTTQGGKTIDVKTARKPNYLAVEVGKVRADIYVLAKYNETTDSAVLLGWEYGDTMKQCEVIEWSKQDPRWFDSHCKEHSELRPIGELKQLMGVEEPTQTTESQGVTRVDEPDSAINPMNGQPAKLPRITGFYCKAQAHVHYTYLNAQRCIYCDTPAD